MEGNLLCLKFIHLNDKGEGDNEEGEAPSRTITYC